MTFFIKIYLVNVTKWSHLPKKSLMENLIFMQWTMQESNLFGGALISYDALGM